MTEVGLNLLVQETCLRWERLLTAYSCALQYWKSNPNFWCEYCRVWLQDNPQARATHERGMKHQENVAKSKYAWIY